MALVSLFFKRPQPTQILRTVGNSITALILDATLKEVFTVKAEVTKHPIEKGADSSDHIVIRPSGLAVSGIITETPFAGISDFLKASGATVGSAVGAALGPFAGAAGAIAGGIGAKSIASAIFGSSDRVLSAVCAEFLKLRDARQPVSIQTGLRLYESYAISSFAATRDQKTGGSITVDLEFEEIIFAESQITQVAIPKVKGAIAGTNHGRQSKQGLSDAESGQGSSLLKKMF